MLQQRMTINFLDRPKKSPRNRVRAQWVIDTFTKAETVIAVRCYKTQCFGGGEYRLMDGWRASSPEAIALRKAEIVEILKSRYTKAFLEPKKTPLENEDTRL